ncbi:MAG TPA: 3-methyladenine DNA glycosylase, partial [Actinomycetales bacterium]|nr:3-methyladenine DNA glycosylase [Actinomycetales bacterium]
MPADPVRLPRALEEDEWRPLAAAHGELVDGWTRGHRERSAAGEAHPVEDFLFTYYSFRPAQLRRWHPGAGTALLGDTAGERLDWRHYGEVEALDGDGRVVKAVGMDVDTWLAARSGALEHVVRLLEATAGRPGRFGCFGLHEWAMVYRLSQDDVRHSAWPLRLGAAGTDAVVDASTIRCSHFDAFRFFTDEARPRNTLQPSRSSQLELEQPGCLHAAMDLYKWAYKLTPAVPSSLVADCFALARDVRVLDMRASPYDLTALGFTPVPIETPEGRAEYV